MFIQTKADLYKVNDIIINMDNVNCIKPVTDSDNITRYEVDFKCSNKDRLILSDEEFNALSNALFESKYD